MPPQSFKTLQNLFVATTERDVYTILFGAMDEHGCLRKNFVAPDAFGNVDRELVNDFNIFNPRYRNLSMPEASDNWASQPHPREQPDPTVDSLSESELLPWQRHIVSLISTPEHKFGRSVYWLWESAGNVGKSVLATYIVDHHKGVLLRGNPNDGLHVVTQYVHDNGHGPQVIIFDIPRSCLEVSYELIENVKNGSFMSGKYESTMVRFNRPHVICFANREPEYSNLSQDRFQVTNIRTLISELEPPMDVAVTPVVAE